MNDHKGKGRAPSENVADNSQQDGVSEGSMFSRVIASASGLTRDAFAAPSGHELKAQAATALADAGKGQPSGAGIHSTERNISAEQPHRSSSLQGSSDAFRLGQSHEHIQISENEFSSFLDSIDAFTPSQGFGEGPQEENKKTLNAASSNGKRPFDQPWGEIWAKHQYVDESKPPGKCIKLPSESVADQEIRDGQEVLDLLSAPLEEVPVEPENQDVKWNIPGEQRSQLRAIIKDLFPEAEPYKFLPPDHPVNLIPDFGASNIMRMPPTAMNAEESYVYMGLNREHFREQWKDVLTRYTDEVWGDLLPLVKEAREEVEHMSDTQQPLQQPKALRRLGAILGHLNPQAAVARDD